MLALVAGGSIAGLSTAHVLRRLGVDVAVLERSDGRMLDRGAGLGLDLSLLQAVLGRATGELPPCIELQGRAVHTAGVAGPGSSRAWQTVREPGLHRVSGWKQLYDALRQGLGSVVQTGAEVVGLTQQDGRWWVGTRDGQRLQADLTATSCTWPAWSGPPASTKLRA